MNKYCLFFNLLSLTICFASVSFVIGSLELISLTGNDLLGWTTTEDDLKTNGLNEMIFFFPGEQELLECHWFAEVLL